MRPARLLAAAVLLLAGGSSGAVGAAQERLRWTWEAPAACPGEADVRARIVRLLGGAIPPGPALAARAEVAAREGGFAVTLRTEAGGGEGERTLVAAGCQDLAEATALIVALMVDPTLTPAVEERDPTPGGPGAGGLLAAPGSEVSSTVTSASHEAAAARGASEAERSAGAGGAQGAAEGGPEGEAERSALTLGVAGVLDVGTLPGPSPGVRLEGTLRWPRASARVRAEAFLAQSVRPGEPEAARASVAAASATALGCGHPLVGRVELALCGAVAAGALFARSRGVSAPGSSAAFWLAAGAGAVLRWWPWPRFGLGVDADALASLVRPRFVVDGIPGDGQVFRPSPVSGRFAAALELRFP
ncbi:MAG: hypothetical protein ACFCGT_20235 [Sandaracinaceae bacterium]